MLTSRPQRPSRNGALALGQPRARAPFRLGRWGLLVNFVALLYGGGMLVNFAWPRPASNPEATQTVVSGDQLVNFHVGFLNRIPILWMVVVVIALVGGVYYLLVGRSKEFPPVTAPAADDPPLAGQAALQRET